MTARDYFRTMLRQRRAFPIGSPDWAYRTRAARSYLNIIRGLPMPQGGKQ